MSSHSPLSSVLLPACLKFTTIASCPPSLPPVHARSSLIRLYSTSTRSPTLLPVCDHEIHAHLLRPCPYRHDGPGRHTGRIQRQTHGSRPPSSRAAQALPQRAALWCRRYVVNSSPPCMTPSCSVGARDTLPSWSTFSASVAQFPDIPHILALTTCSSR